MSNRCKFVTIFPFTFFVIEQAPADAKHVNLTVQEITDQMWPSRNFLANVKPEVDDEIAKVQQKMITDFVTSPWMSNNIKSSITTVPHEDTPMSDTFVANNTALKSVFQRISAQFAKLYERKAFLHWCKREGMYEIQFTCCVFVVLDNVISWLWSLFCVVCAPKRWNVVLCNYN